MTRSRLAVLVIATALLGGCADDKSNLGPTGFHELDAGNTDAADGGPADLDASSDPLGPSPDASPDGGGDVGGDAGSDLGPPEDWEEGAWIIGESVQNRPIVAEHYGVEGPVLFLIAGFHGNERSGVTFGEQIRAVLQGGLAERAGIRVVLLPTANPDGIASSKRHNANDIDLNRNFPTENFGQGTSAGGTTPLSEPESRAIRAAVDQSFPTAVISLHCCVPIMDYDGPARDLSETMAQAMEPAFRYPVDRLGSLPGSFGSYVGLELDLPIITLEYALDEIMDAKGQFRNVERAIEAATDWVASNGETPERAGVAGLVVDDSPLDAFALTESAGGLPVRVESFVQGSGAPILLLSGLVDNDRRALNVAEHIRRELIANVRDIPMVMLTAANPDGIESASTLNSAGGDVASDLFDGDPATPEAEGIEALFDSLAPRLVVHVQTDTFDSVSVRGLSAESMAGAIPDELLDAGEATGPLADWLADRDVELLDLGVNGIYGRGDNRRDDFFEQGDPALYSVLVRRLIKPEQTCIEDAFCDPLCPSDPDCDCACDFYPICEAEARGSDQACACDPQCADGAEACSGGNRCDTWCPTDVDPDCACSCDHNAFCEAAARGTADTCRCDLDCGGGLEACSADEHCDTWCPDGVDPDC